MPDAIIIRRRRDDDLPALATVLVRVHAVDGYPVEGVADPEAWLRPPHELMSWTAEEAGTPVGQITLTRATADDDDERQAAPVTRKEQSAGRSVSTVEHRTGAGGDAARCAVPSGDGRTGSSRF